MSDIETKTTIAVGWKNPPALGDLKQDYKGALPYHNERLADINSWLDAMHVRGAHKPPQTGKNSKVVPKLIRKQAEWRYPALSEPFLSTDELFQVEPTTWEDREAALQNGAVLNYQFNNQINKQRFIDAYVRTAVDHGTVFLRPGWVYEERKVTVEEPVFQYVPDPRYEQIYTQLAQMHQESPSQFLNEVPLELQEGTFMFLEEQVAYAPIKTGMEKVEKVEVVQNKPTAEIWRPENVIIDPSCEGDYEKANFVVFRTHTSKSEMRKMGIYKNLDSIGDASGSGALAASDSSVTTPPESQHSFTFADSARQKVWLYEYWGYWDINGDGKAMPIVAAWVGDTLVRLEENPFPGQKIPLIVVNYLPREFSVYGESDGYLLEDNQKVLGAVTRGTIDLLGRSANSQIGMRKDFLDVTNRRKFERGEDYEFNPTVDPRIGTFMHTFPEIPQSALLVMQMQQQEAESLTGVKSYSSGIGSAALGDVAAGIRGALDAASKRELGILRRLAAGIVELGKRILMMNGEFLSDTEVIRITNSEFIKVNREALLGNFDVKLSISTAEENNNKASDLGFMLQTAGSNMDPGLYKVILADIARLKKMPDLARRIEAYEPQPDPMQEQMRELELQKAQLEVMKLQAEIGKLGAVANLDNAKADHVQATIDKMSLDFVEQERGVTQARKKELVGEQSRSQMELLRLKGRMELESKLVDSLTMYDQLRKSGPTP